MDRPGTAALLSFIIPGAGQIYNGKFLRGIVWLIVTPGLWLGTGGFLGWVCHLVSSYMAYQWAKDHPPHLALSANDESAEERSTR
jgi:TM2 domain-containing membrane protein YozV